MEEAPEPQRAALLTVRQAAAMLNIGRTTTYALITSGELEVIHIGRTVRVPRVAVSEFVERRRLAAADAPQR
jgi:excisionase family DNA binding protein